MTSQCQHKQWIQIRHQDKLICPTFFPNTQFSLFFRIIRFPLRTHVSIKCPTFFIQQICSINWGSQQFSDPDTDLVSYKKRNWGHSIEAGDLVILYYRSIWLIATFQYKVPVKVTKFISKCSTSYNLFFEVLFGVELIF